MKTFLFFLLVLMAGMLLLQPLLGNAILLNPDYAAAQAAQIRENTRHDNAMHLTMEQLAGMLVELAPGLVYLVVGAVSTGLVLMLTAVGVGIALYFHHRGR